MCAGSSDSYFWGQRKEIRIARTTPEPQLHELPARALVRSPVVAMVMAPDRTCVVTNQAMRPIGKAIMGAAIAATVEILEGQSRINPSGIPPPPTIIPKQVISQVISTPL